MKAKDMLIKAMKRPGKERGLKITNPNNYLSEGHLEKADHNLVVMTDLSRLGHEDWAVIAAYYAMYHSALALLLKIGLESKEHATTASALEYFFGEHISKEAIGEFNELKERKDKVEATIGEKYINYLWKAKQAREAVQYGISMNYKETNILMSNAREFAGRMKIVGMELNDKLVAAILKKASELMRVSMQDAQKGGEDNNEKQ